LILVLGALPLRSRLRGHTRHAERNGYGAGPANRPLTDHVTPSPAVDTGTTQNR
ncbi:MAG: hypothetical protein H0V26_09640, partial [Solirubrobacterales bacterium]|nr:hypothetical protein [Solirubrobacterales bacterium]